MKKPIIANLENNSIDLLCYNDNEDIQIVKDSEYVNCELLFKGLHFNGEIFDIILEIVHMSEHEETKYETNEVVEDTHIDNEVQEHTEDEQNKEQVEDENENEDEENEDEEEDEENEDEDEDEEEEKEPISVNEPIELLDNDIEEVELDLDDSESNTDEMKLNLEKDNLFMIYDILNEKLRLNLFNSVTGLIEKNKYNLGEFDLDDILFDDEDSDEDSDNESDVESDNDLE